MIKLYNMYPRLFIQDMYSVNCIATLKSFYGRLCRRGLN